MSLNGTLKVFNITWIIWIYLFVLLLHFDPAHAKIGYFWHITDLHLDSAYSTKGDVTKECRPIDHHQTNSAVGELGRFGDYFCESPWSLLESAAQAMRNRQGDNVEFVLWTGDGLAHSTRRLNENSRLDLLRNITDLLGRTFSSQFVFPVLGHEDGHNNNFRHLGELWRHWLPSEALQTFDKGGYYTIEQKKSRLRIIALNTNYMRQHDNKHSYSRSAAVRQRPSYDSSEYNNYHYSNHHSNHYRGNSGNNINGYYTSGGMAADNAAGGMASALSGTEHHESEKQWTWLEEVLVKSKQNKETVYIVGHMPPGSDERQDSNFHNGHTTFSEKNNFRYLELVRRYSSIIAGQFFGHLHSDSFRIIYDATGNPVSWIMIAPSVTPKRTSGGSNNPAMRLYKFETDTGQVLDYTQYYLDLDMANAAGDAVWQPEYNLTTYYFGAGEVTAVALHNLADDFGNKNKESPLFAKYYRANSVRYFNGPCEGMCAHNHFCAITRVDYDEYRHCRESAASALASSADRPYRSIPLAAQLTLILALYATIKRQSRQLLYSWFNFGWLTLVNMSKAMYIGAVINFAHKLNYMWLSYCCTKLFNNHIMSSTNYRSSNSLSIRKSNIFMIAQFWLHIIDAAIATQAYASHWLNETWFRKNQHTIIIENGDDDCNDKYNDCSKRIHISNHSNQCETTTRILCQNKLQLLGSANQIDRLFRCSQRCDVIGYVMCYLETKRKVLSECN